MGIYLFVAKSPVGPGWWQRFVLMHPGDVGAAQHHVRLKMSDPTWRVAKVPYDTIPMHAQESGVHMVCAQEGVMEVKVTGGTDNTNKDSLVADELNRQNEDGLNGGSERL